ncbi:2,3-diaminopropionate biosynthesis protein SbnA [Nocardiopsis rhodophaea]|uniref:2,3-diaminopropionate biosynthesis protein SbnA n=1 Tax=Nocardiopsis rhodophaea TaxID=280238 RepID=A0ABN2T8Q8_9ACTN
MTAKTLDRVDGFGRLVSDTPTTRLDITVNDIPRTLRLKLDGHNIGGSIKARTAYGLVRDLAQRGRLEPDTEIVESTSGNLGIALALIGKYFGVRVTTVADPLITDGALRRLRELGARVEMVHEQDQNGGYLLSRLERVRQLLDGDPRRVWTDQYNNPANPRIHEITTGPEMRERGARDLDAVFLAISTGGTLAGVSADIKQASPSTSVVAVDIAGSIAYRGAAAPRRANGIGASRRSTFLEDWMIDDFRSVTLADMAASCRAMLDEHGLYLGASSGAVLAACFRYLADNPDARDVCCLCPDLGEKYASTSYNTAWLRSAGCSGRNLVNTGFPSAPVASATGRMHGGTARTHRRPFWQYNKQHQLRSSR